MADDVSFNAMRRQILERDGHKCRECGSSSALRVHHIEQRASGGPYSADNLITLCETCHREKHRIVSHRLPGLSADLFDKPQLRLSKETKDHIANFGRAGESLETALIRVLDKAEKYDEEHGKS